MRPVEVHLVSTAMVSISTVEAHQLRRRAVGAVARAELATGAVAPRVRATRCIDRHRVAASACERGERDRSEIAQELRRRVRARVATAELTYVENKVAQAKASWIAAFSAREYLRPPQAPANLGLSATWSALTGHTGRVVDTGADRARCSRTRRPARLASQARRPAAAAPEARRKVFLAETRRQRT